jgi:hypothetical protein
LVTTISPRLITEISVVPPPISQIMCPAGSLMGISAPMAAARLSGITTTSLAPALYAHSSTALRSTSVILEGIPITMRGLINLYLGKALEIK